MAAQRTRGPHRAAAGRLCAPHRCSSPQPIPERAIPAARLKALSPHQCCLAVVAVRVPLVVAATAAKIVAAMLAAQAGRQSLPTLIQPPTARSPLATSMAGGPSLVLADRARPLSQTTGYDRRGNSSYCQLRRSSLHSSGGVWPSRQRRRPATRGPQRKRRTRGRAASVSARTMTLPWCIDSHIRVVRASRSIRHPHFI